MCASEMGAVDVDRPRHRRARPARPRPHAGRQPAVRRRAQHRASRSTWPPRRPTPSGPPTASSHVPPGEPIAEPPADLARAPGRQRLHQGGAGHGAQAHGHRRLRAHLLDGRRLAAAADGRPRPTRRPLPAPALRPGHQPADRPAARAAGDEPARRCSGPAPPLLLEQRRRQPGCSALESFFLYPVGGRLAARPRPATRSRSAASTPRFPVADGPDGLRGRGRAAWPTSADALVDGGAGILVIDRRRRSTAERAPVPSLLALGAVHQRLVATGRRSRHQPRRGRRRRPRHPLGRRPARLRRRRRVPPPRPADRGRRGRRGRHRRPRQLRRPGAASRAAIEAGVLKILSKMGISTVDSLPGRADSSRSSAWPTRSSTSASPAPPTTVGGHRAGRRSARTSSAHHAAAFPVDADAEPDLESPGYFRVRKGGEYHAHSKEVTQALNELTLVLDDAAGRPSATRQAVDQAAAHLLQRAIAARGLRHVRAPSLEAGRRAAPDRAARPARRGAPIGPPVPLDEVEPATRDRPALLDRRDVARLALEGGPRDPRPGHEPHRRPLELRRGRRGPGPLPHPRPRARRQELAHQAGRLGPLRRDARVPGPRRRDPDQDGPGLQAGRGRPAPGPQGVGRDRPPAPHPARRRPHLPAAPPRHLLHRGPRPAHLRPQAGERRPGVGEAGGRRQRRHHRRRRGEGAGRRRAHLRRQRRHRRLARSSSIKHAGLPWELGLADTQQALVDNGLRGRVRAAGRRRLQDRPPRAGRRACSAPTSTASAPRR